MAENAKWMDSIEGKSQQLANSMQALWNDTINSKVIKYFYDVAMSVTEAIHAFGPWKTVLAGIATYFTVFKKINLKSLFTDIGANVKNYTGAIAQVSKIKGMNLGTTSTGALNSASVIAYADALKGMSAQQQAAILTSQGLSKAHTAQVLAQNGVEQATIQQIVGLEALNASKAKAISMTGAEMSELLAQQGVKLSDVATTYLQNKATEELTQEKILTAAASGALQKATMGDISALLSLVGATSAASTGIKGLGASMLAMAKLNPFGTIMTVISLVMTVVSLAKPLVEDFFKSTEDKLKDLESEWKTLSDTINTASTDFKTLKSSADDVIPRFAELAEGVDQFGNNVKLTDEEYKEFLSLNNQIAEMFPEINNGMDANGNAMLSLSLTANTLEDSLWSLVEAERAAANEEIAKTMPDVLTNIDSTVKQYEKEIENVKAEQSTLEWLYNEIDSGRSVTVTGGRQRENIKNMLDAMGVSYTETENLEPYVPEYTFTVDPSSIDKAKQNYDNAMAGLGKEIQNINEKVAKKWSQLNPVLTAWTQTDYTYQGLSDEMQKVVQGIIGNIDFEAAGLDTAEKVQNYVKNDIINVIDGASYDVQKAITSMFLAAGGTDNQGQLLDVEQYKRAVEQFKNDIQTLDFVGDKSLIYQLFGMGEDGSGDTDIDKAIKHVEGLLRKGYDELSDEAQSYINQLSVDDVLYIKAKISPEFTGLEVDELQKKINETYEFNISDFKSQITGMSDSISTYQEALQKLEKGSFTLSDFMELIEDMPELAKGVDISSNAFYGLASNLRGAIKTSTKSLIVDLKNLRYRLLDAGKSTTAIDQLIESIENMPENALDGVIDQYGTLADEIDRALTKQNLLSAAMEEEPTGYETRGEAMEYMKGKLEEGKIGSESNVWNVAEQYGFTYDSAKTLNENADALAKFIAVRERWFKEADDGDDRTDDGYAFEGIENFIQDVETAAKKIDELEWTYDEDTGTLNFDFDNENLDEIVQSLSQMDQFAGLTKEEFIDMIKWVGQYFNINWSDNDDILMYLDGVATSAKDAQTKVEEYGAAMQKYLGGDTTIDLTARPMVTQEKMQEAGWTDFDGDYATLYSHTFSKSDFGMLNEGELDTSIVVTPILPNGKDIVSPEDLELYAKKLLAGEEIDPGIDIKLGEFDSQEEANKYAEAASKAQAQFYQLKDTLNINTTIDNEGLNGLRQIKEVQAAISTNADGTTIIDGAAFSEALIAAGYTEDQIDVIYEKIRKINADAFSTDPLNIDSAKSIDDLQQIQQLQKSIKKDAATGWSVVDVDIFEDTLKKTGYTETQIGNIIKKVQEFNNVVMVSGFEDDPLGLDNATRSIDEFKTLLGNFGVQYEEARASWFGTDKELTINVTDLVTTLKEKNWTEEEIREYCNKLAQVNIDSPGFTVKVSQEEIDAAIEKADEVPEEKPIECEVIGDGLQTLKDIKAAADAIPTEITTTHTTEEITVKKTEEDDGFNLFKPSTWFANGTAHASGTAFAGGNWGAPKTETALTGELGPEILVRGNRWTTVGENGAEFTQVKRGDIIFNHKQSEQLLKNGYVTSRGKAYASGTAYAKGGSTFAKYSFSGDGGYTKYDVNDNVVDKFGNAADKLSDAADKVSDSSEEFKESIDWIEIRIEELNESLALKSAQLENAVGAKAQNKIIDSMIADNQVLYDNLIAGANEYYSHAKTLLGKIPAQFRDAAKNGSIAITEFAGKTSEEAYNAIQEYRDWVQKGADATQQAEEVITEIRSLAVQAFDNIAAQYDGENSITEAKNAKLEAAMNRAEERGRPISEAYYLEMAGNTFDLMDQKKSERKDLQSELNKKVRNGEIEVGGKDYNKMVAQILELDAEIIDLETDLESYQNSINELGFQTFDEAIERLQNISDETQNVIDLLSEKDLFDENGVWSKEGIATIGLYGQQMENAKLQADKYAQEIEYLNDLKDKQLISEDEYADKMAELKKGHYGAIKSYNDAEDAIVDMNKARVEAIKEGIDKEIEAYDKLIEKKKEELDSEKDLHDFRKKSQETTKNIADIERQLAALAGDNSMAAQAKRARLEAELAEARTEQEEMYYERSVANQQEALDKERENFTAEKEAEKEEWDKSLEDTKAVIAEAFKSLEENAAGVNTTLTGLAEEYGLKLSDAIVNPWTDGATTMGTYWSSFTTLGSDAITGLTTQLDTFYKSLDVAEKRANAVIEAQNKKNQKTMEEKNPKKPTQTGNGNGNGNGGKTNNPPKAGATVTVKKSATHFGPQSGSKKMASFVPGGTYTVYETMGSGNNTQVLIGKNGAYTGWIKLTDIQGYATGTTGVKKDQFAWIDEMGLEELVMHADGQGKLAYLSKGSAVIPHDLSENLMAWGSLDPSNMLEQNRPSIGVNPEVHNTEINLDCSVGTMINIEHCDQGTLPDVEKMVNKAFDKHMQTLNNSIKKFVR